MVPVCIFSVAVYKSGQILSSSVCSAGAHGHVADRSMGSTFRIPLLPCARTRADQVLHPRRRTRRVSRKPWGSSSSNPRATTASHSG